MKTNPVRMKWDSFTYPIKAGTPVSIYGVEANNSAAIGFVPQEIPNAPKEEYAQIVIEGIFTLADLEKKYGQSYSNDALRNMSGILFYGPDGTPVPDPVWTPYVLPAATASKIGGVKMAANVADAAGDAPTAAEYKALLDALKAAGIMVADAT